MTTSKRPTLLYWFLFLLSSVAFGVAIQQQFEYLTLIIPFVCTFLVLAMDII
jgi:hypothetical protein